MSHRPLFPEPNFLALFVGRRRSGKTHLLVRLLLSPEAFLYRFENIYILSPSYTSQEIWQKIKVPASHVSEGLDEKFINHILRQQKTRVETGKAGDDDCLVILDDCVDDKSFRYSKALQTIAIRGRHLKISCIILSQKVTLLPPTLRTNADQVVAFATQNFNELMAIFNEWGQGSFHNFRQFFERLTGEPHTFLYVDLTKPTREQLHAGFKPVRVNLWAKNDSQQHEELHQHGQALPLHLQSGQGGGGWPGEIPHPITKTHSQPPGNRGSLY